MSARGEEALLALLLAVPSVVGTFWFQTLGADGLPGGRAPWLVLLYTMPPVIAVVIALRRGHGASAARRYGIAIAVLAALVAWHPPVAMDGRGWARVLAVAGLASGASIAVLAGRVTRRAPACASAEVEAA